MIKRGTGESGSLTPREVIEKFGLSEKTALLLVFCQTCGKVLYIASESNAVTAAVASLTYEGHSHLVGHIVSFNGGISDCAVPTHVKMRAYVRNMKIFDP